MGLTIAIETDDGISEFTALPADRRRNDTRRIAVDSEGRECRPVLVTHDGHLLDSGSTALVYEDAAGNAFDRREVVQTDEHGNPLRTLSSTIGRAVGISGPVSPDELLEYVTLRAYALIPMRITPALREQLEAECIFRVPFRPRASCTEHPAFVLSNDQGVFLLQGRLCRAEFVTMEQVIVVDHDEEEDFEPWDDEWNRQGEGGDAW